MEIIDNINGRHYDRIQTILSTADEMLLVSPFLMEDFDAFIHDIGKLGVKRISLITMLKDNSADLLKKSNSLYSFCFSCKQNGVDFKVHIDKNLHGKIYIALKDGIPIKGIVTSANFTDRGLAHSHEWGVEIDDSQKLQGIIDDLYKCSSGPLSEEEIGEIVKTIDDYTKANPIIKESKPPLNVTQHFPSKPKTEEPVEAVGGQIDFPEDTRYFIKPLGSTGTPFTPQRTISATTMEIQFANRRPNQVRSGDILICYGVGTTKLLGCFRITSDPYYVQDALARWPWRVQVVNLSPQYSSSWWTYDNTLSSAIASYGAGKPLTYVGGKSLGALSFGADKIRLNESFAHHLINIIV